MARRQSQEECVPTHQILLDVSLALDMREHQVLAQTVTTGQTQVEGSVPLTAALDYGTDPCAHTHTLCV